MAAVDEDGHELQPTPLRVPSWIYEADIPLRDVRFSPVAVSSLEDLECGGTMRHCVNAQHAEHLIRQVQDKRRPYATDMYQRWELIVYLSLDGCRSYDRISGVPPAEESQHRLQWMWKDLERDRKYTNAGWMYSPCTLGH